MLKAASRHLGLLLIVASVLLLAHGVHIWRRHLGDHLVGICVLVVLSACAAIATMAGWQADAPAEPESVVDYPTEFATDFAVDRETLLASPQLLIRPMKHVHRIVHEVAPRDGHIEHSVSREIALPPRQRPKRRRRRPPEPVTYFVPLLFPKRGRLVDNISTSSSVESHLPLLQSPAARMLTYRILATLTMSHYADAPESLKDDVRITLKGLESALLDASFPAPNGNASPLGELVGHAQRYTAATPLWHRRAGRLHELWNAAAHSYIVFGCVHTLPGSTVHLTVRYTLPLAAEREPDRVTWAIKDRVRFVLGQQPHVYRLPLPYVHETTSYHMRFLVGEEQYVYETIVRADRPDEAKTHLVTHEGSRSTATSYAHLYIRPLELRQAGERSLRATIQLREQPPGLLGLISFMSLLQFVVALTLLVFHRSLFALPNDSNSDLPSLLVAVPGLMAAWLANQITPSRLKHTPLATMGGIICTGVLSIASTLGAALAARGVEWRSVPHLFHDNPRLLWWLLAFLAGYNALNLGLRWYRNTKTYVARFNRLPELAHYRV